MCKHAQLDELAWVTTHLESADDVFLGTVSSAEFPESHEPEEPILHPEPQDEEPLSMTALLEKIEKAMQESNNDRFDQVVSFDVVDIWKGSFDSVIAAKNRVVPGNYGTPLKVAETYLVFANESGDETLRVSTACGTTKLAENATGRIEVLNNLAIENEPTSSSPH